MYNGKKIDYATNESSIHNRAYSRNIATNKDHMRQITREINRCLYLPSAIYGCSNNYYRREKCRQGSDVDPLRIPTTESLSIHHTYDNARLLVSNAVTGVPPVTSGFPACGRLLYPVLKFYTSSRRAKRYPL